MEEREERVLDPVEEGSYKGVDEKSIPKKNSAATSCIGRGASYALTSSTGKREEEEEERREEEEEMEEEEEEDKEAMNCSPLSLSPFIFFPFLPLPLPLPLPVSLSSCQV